MFLGFIVLAVVVLVSLGAVITFVAEHPIAAAAIGCGATALDGSAEVAIKRCPIVARMATHASRTGMKWVYATVVSLTNTDRSTGAVVSIGTPVLAESPEVSPITSAAAGIDLGALQGTRSSGSPKEGPGLP